MSQFSIYMDTPTFIIDSDDRLHGSVEEFTVEVPMKPNNNYNMVSLVHAVIPKTYYNVNPANYSFTLTENSVSRTSTILVGNYTISEFETRIASRLNFISSLINAINPWTYTVTYDTFTQTFIYDVLSVAGRPIVSASFTFSNHQMHDIFGFEDNTTNSFAVGGLSGTLSSTVIPNLNLTEYISIKSNIANNAGNADSDSSVLARIPISNVAFGESIIYDVIQLQDAVRNITTNTSNIFFFGLYDDHNRPMKLNGRGWFLTLFMYNHNPLPLLEYNRLQKQIEQEELARMRGRDDIDIRVPMVQNIDVLDQDDIEEINKKEDEKRVLENYALMEQKNKLKKVQINEPKPIEETPKTLLSEIKSAPRLKRTKPNEPKPKSSIIFGLDPELQKGILSRRNAIQPDDEQFGNGIKLF